MPVPDDETLDQALAELRERGRSYVKSRDVALQLGLDPTETSVLTSVGSALGTHDDVGRWSPESVDGNATWDISGIDADEGQKVRADGGTTRECHACGADAPAGRDCPACGAAPWTDEPLAPDGGHNLEALRQGIAATADAADDTERRIGDYVFQSKDTWSGAPASHVIVDYRGYPAWAVIPFDFADTVCEAIDDRLAADGPEPEDYEILTDGGTQGAVDNDYDDAARTPADVVAANLAGAGDDAPTHQALGAGDVAIDLVTRQTLFVRERVAESVVEYYDDEEFDLGSYKMHPWLPVRPDDPVLECVFVGDTDGLHNFSDTYDYPAGRLARVPVELAGGDGA